MEDPKTQMREYLEKLEFRFLFFRSLQSQIAKISEWESSTRIETLNMSHYFFRLTQYSFGRTVMLELYKFVSEKEDRSIQDFLSKAREHAEALEPSEYRPGLETGRSRVMLTPQEYRAIIGQQTEEMEKHSKTIERLKGRRDKDLAHSDTAFFNNPDKLLELYPLTNLDITSLMETISGILRKQHSLLFKEDMAMEVVNADDVDTVLTNARAFSRVWRDKRVTRDCGIMVYKYLEDDYDPRKTD